MIYPRRVDEMLAVMRYGIKLDVIDHKLFVALAERVADCVAHTLKIFIGDFQTVDDKLDAVVLIAVELHAVGDFLKLAVDADVEETLLAQLLEKFFVMTFAVLDKRREYIDLVTAEFIEDERNDFLFGIFYHLLTADIASRTSDTGEEQSQEVVDFCCRADGASRIAVDGLLLDGNDGAESADVVDVGALEAIRACCGHTTRRSRYNGAVLRHRLCRKQAKTCRCR